MTARYDEQRKAYGVAGKAGNFTPLIIWKPESKVLVRRVDSNHFFGKYRGYGISTELIDCMMKETGTETPLYIVKNNTGEVYKTRIGDWKERGVLVNYGQAQYILPVTSMEKVK